jgi:hypothetical protein
MVEVYVMANPKIVNGSAGCWIHIEDEARQRVRSPSYHWNGNVRMQWHMEIEDGYDTGYKLLHQTAPERGDFQVYGKAAVTEEGDRFTIAYSLKYAWHDSLHPNWTQHKYEAAAAWAFKELFNLAAPPDKKVGEDYYLDIIWTAPCNVAVDKRTLRVSGTGWPFTK